MADPHSVDCPSCGARRGRYCFSIGGVSHGYYRTPHAARVRAAERAEAEKEKEEEKGA